MKSERARQEFQNPSCPKKNEPIQHFKENWFKTNGQHVKNKHYKTMIFIEMGVWMKKHIFKWKYVLQWN